MPRTWSGSRRSAAPRVHRRPACHDRRALRPLRKQPPPRRAHALSPAATRLTRGLYFFGSIRAAPAAGATMLSRPSSQRTRYRGGCSCSTSSTTPLCAGWPTRSDSRTMLSPTRASISASFGSCPLASAVLPCSQHGCDRSSSGGRRDVVAVGRPNREPDRAATNQGGLARWLQPHTPPVGEQPVSPLLELRHSGERSHYARSGPRLRPSFE